MAKVCKKSSKKSVKKKTEEVTPDVVYDDDDEGDDLNDENIPSDEEEEPEDDERTRQKLLEAIGSLGAKRKKTLGERSEAAVQVSEFSVTAEGEGDKLDLAELIGTLDKTPSVSSKTKKQLKTLQQGSQTIQTPLSKQESERIQRDVAFQKAAAEVTKWKPLIKQNQRAEQLVFPLNREPLGPKPMERVVSGWKARTPLEEEVFALLSANKQPIHDPVLTPSEEASLKAMSLEEAKIRRAELQKARALQSYYEAKARRESKIKSKKYHKIQNKAKRRSALKQFDQLASEDPEAALEELGRMELARVQERMSLKHQNSSKWARSRAIMAKYDQGARRAMQEQLEVNRELTKKVTTPLEEEEEQEEEEEGGDGELLPDFVNDAERKVDASNPWMRGKLTEETTEEEARGDLDLTAEPAKTVEEEEEEEEEEETEEEALLREFDSRRKKRQEEEEEQREEVEEEQQQEEEQREEEEEEEQQQEEEEQREEEEEQQQREEEEEEEQQQEEQQREEEEEEQQQREEEEDKEEEQQLSEFTSVFRGIMNSCREEQEAKTDSSAQLDEGLSRIRTLEDVDLLEQEEVEEVSEAPPPAPEQAPPPAKASRKRRRDIELKEVLTKDTKTIRVPLAPTVEDGEDQDLDQRGLISEAFAGDDVVSDFLKDKRKQEDSGKPQVVDLTLPGWGEWGGTGLRPSRSKRRRFRQKAAPAPARKDRQLHTVIISEKRNAALSAHQVSSLPFPFQSHAQFEGAIRSPLGRTWNTESTVKKATKLRVVTQLGAIIQPMTREDLLKDQKQRPAGGAQRAPGSQKKKPPRHVHKPAKKI